MEILVPKKSSKQLGKPIHNTSEILNRYLGILAKLNHKIQNNILENPSSLKHLGSPVCNASAILDYNSWFSNPMPFPYYIFPLLTTSEAV